MNSPRSLAVVIPTLDGRERLEECLGSLARLDPPGLPWHVVVFDNGSGPELGRWLAGSHPAVVVLRADENLGFAAAVDRAAATLDADLLCVVNDDMRFAPDFLARLVGALDPAHGVRCVGARIVAWDGRTIEFDGGTMSLCGHAAPLRHGEAVAAWPPGAPFETLFCCGGALLIERRLFLEAGGFDPGYFAYYEDVDLGWRLHVLGERCLHVPAATAFHREHGTEAALPAGRRLELLERNALATLYKNLEPERGERVLRYALALLAERARLAPSRAAACGAGLQAFVAALPALEASRQALQARRRRSDAEIAPLFRDPWRPAIAGEGYRARQAELARLFRVADLFPLEPAGHPATPAPRGAEIGSPR